MTRSRYIHGGTDPAEVARLEKQARFLSRWILTGVEAGPGALVLDLACGTGAMMRRLAAQLPDARLVGCDLSLDQLRASRQKEVACADAGSLPFADGAFDVVHCSWLLEHVPPPRAVEILREMRRVLRPGGDLWLCEVDDDLLAFWPRVPLAEECFRKLWRAQAEGGGDPIIGRKLHALCARAGFTDIHMFPATLHVNGGSPAGYVPAMVAEFAEILDSARAALADDARVERALAELRALEANPEASLTAMAFRVRASR